MKVWIMNIPQPRRPVQSCWRWPRTIGCSSHLQERDVSFYKSMPKGYKNLNQSRHYIYSIGFSPLIIYIWKHCSPFFSSSRSVLYKNCHNNVKKYWLRPVANFFIFYFFIFLFRIHMLWTRIWIHGSVSRIYRFSFISYSWPVNNRQGWGKSECRL